MTSMARPNPRYRSAITGPVLALAATVGLLVGTYGLPLWEAWLAGQKGSAAKGLDVGRSPDLLSAHFDVCHSGGAGDCVIDGDTFRFQGEKIRIADIDTPETHSPQCAEEADRGAKATSRLHSLMNAGPFTLVTGERATDRYGQTLRVVTRNGQSIGVVLVSEGLARPSDGARRPWC